MRQPEWNAARREERVVQRERTAHRIMRWRVRLLAFLALDLALALALLLVALPAHSRTRALEIVFTLLAMAGALPLVASTVEWGIVGLHYLRIPYRRLGAHYPRVAVVVPAWNEGFVIGATIDRLIAMEYPEERLRVYVVDDASTDETPAIVGERAARHGGRVFHLRRETGGQGKAHTLNHGIARVLDDDWAEAVLIMDADVLFEPGALRRMTRHLADPRVGAVTAYIKEGSREPNYLNRFVAFEYATAQAGARRAQNIIGALACLAGGAQLHSRENLVAIGGRIDTSTLAEDTVTTFTTQMLGRRVEFDGNAVVWAEEPKDLDALWRQRLRWGRGNVQVSLQFAGMWGRGRAFPWRTLLPFSLIWFSVLLMPLLMLAAAIGFIGLHLMDPTRAWRAFTLLWIWHAVAWIFGTAMAFAIDPATARKAWGQAILFPGIVSLGIFAYATEPALFHALALRAQASVGVVPGETVREAFTLFIYGWCFISLPLAYLARVCAAHTRWRALSAVILYAAGYGAFLAAVTAAAYLKELRNDATIWEKTIKLGLVRVPARGGGAA